MLHFAVFTVEDAWNTIANISILFQLFAFNVPFFHENKGDLVNSMICPIVIKQRTIYCNAEVASSGSVDDTVSI